MLQPCYSQNSQRDCWSRSRIAVITVSPHVSGCPRPPAIRLFHQQLRKTTGYTRILIAKGQQCGKHFHLTSNHTYLKLGEALFVHPGAKFNSTCTSRHVGMWSEVVVVEVIIYLQLLVCVRHNMYYSNVQLAKYTVMLATLTLVSKSFESLSYIIL